MTTRWIELNVTGETMPAYVARPDGAASAGVVVLQEIFGVNADMTRIADLLASVGYLAIVPALFHRTDPHFDAAHDEAGVARGRAAAGPLGFEQLEADVAAAAAFVRETLGPDARVGTWGFCFGGSVAYLSAASPSVDAAVVFYGGQIAKAASPDRPPALVMTNEIHAPLLLAFGGRDESITAGDRAKIREALEAAHATFDFRVYDDEGHAFFRGGPDANESARDVWPRVESFFREHLRAEAPSR